MMKKISLCFFFLITLIIFLSANQVSFSAPKPADWKDVQKNLELLQGDWYNDDGELVISIKGNYINGCQVLSASQFAGANRFAAATFNVRESAGIRGIKIMFQIFDEKSDYIVVDDSVTLHKTKDYWYESIGGIHLGMSAKNLKNTMGEPNRIKSHGKYGYTWYYDDNGLEISFSGNGVSNITIMKSCKLKLAKSGLNSNNTTADFIKFYGWKPRDGKYYLQAPNPISGGEFIWFSEDMQKVSLSIYWS